MPIPFSCSVHGNVVELINKYIELLLYYFKLTQKYIYSSTIQLIYRSTAAIYLTNVIIFKNHIDDLSRHCCISLHKNIFSSTIILSQNCWNLTHKAKKLSWAGEGRPALSVLVPILNQWSSLKYPPLYGQLAVCFTDGRNIILIILIDFMKFFEV